MPATRAARRGPGPARMVVWLVHVALPLLALWLLVAQPRFDVAWENHQAHFWLVLAGALVNVALAWRVSVEARQHGDARLLLVSIAFMAAGVFLGLHALATPDVIIGKGNPGFIVATPVGLILSAFLVAASAVELAPAQAAAVVSRRSWLLLGLGAIVGLWAAASLLELPPLDGQLGTTEAHGPLIVLAVVGSLLYLLTALRYFAIHRRRPSVMLVSLATSFVLLAAALFSVAYSRNWHATWWEWHILITAAFGFVAYSAHVQYRREGSSTTLFTGVSLDHTMAQLREEYGAALEELVTAMRDRSEQDAPLVPMGPLAARVAESFGLTERQVEVLERAAEALADEREQLQNLGALVAIGQEARLIRSEEELLGRALAAARAGFRRDRIELSLLDQGRIDASALGRLAMESQHAEEERRETGMALALPITVKDQAAGVIEAVRPRGSFSDRDRSALNLLASQVSIALENARLYRQIDGLFRRYMSPDVVTSLLTDPAQAELGGTIREVTVLFADLRGYTSFSERTSPDKVVALLNRYFGLAVPVILNEGGTVVQFVGDALMALWNAPVPQADHAHRAARAGLALQAAIEAETAGRPELPRFRVGVNTGPALVGNIGSTEMRNFTAIGDTTNLAARLETSAQVGTVVIGPTVYERIKDVAEVEALGPLELKGKEAAVHAYRLLRLRSEGASSLTALPS